jgi:hypothetical protein
MKFAKQLNDGSVEWVSAKPITLGMRGRYSVNCYLWRDDLWRVAECSTGALMAQSHRESDAKYAASWACTRFISRYGFEGFQRRLNDYALKGDLCPEQ